MKYGVPFDVAFKADASWRLAALVVFGEQEGAKWSWHGLQWEKA